jgi:hypothetical protein
MKPKTDQELLVIYDALPSLLDIATKQAKEMGGYSYDIQNELQDQFYAQGKAFRRSMPYRSLFQCLQCGLMTTQIQHTLFNPGMQEIDSTLHVVELREEDIHHIREHGAAFSADCRRFLEQVSGQIG